MNQTEIVDPEGNDEVEPKKGRRHGLSSVQRTIRALRNQGAICDIAEKWNPHVGPYGIRQDLFGFIDLIVLAPNSITAVQCCTGSAYGEHLKNILDNQFAPEWLKSGGKIQIWAWRKVKAKRGGKLMLWQPRIQDITTNDFYHQEGLFDGLQPTESPGYHGADEAGHGPGED